MIPQAITASGPYADLWSEFHSMRHALRRAREFVSTKDLTRLDQARLQSLLRFLQEGHSTSQSGAIDNLCDLHASTGPRFSLGIDVETIAKGLPAFTALPKSAGRKQTEICTILVEKLGQALAAKSDELMSPSIHSSPELDLLDELLTRLIQHAEASLAA